MSYFTFFFYTVFILCMYLTRTDFILNHTYSQFRIATFLVLSSHMRLGVTILDSAILDASSFYILKPCCMGSE